MSFEGMTIEESFAKPVDLLPKEVKIIGFIYL